MQYILQSSNDKTPEDRGYELICNKSTMLDKLPVLGYWRYGAIDYRSELSLKETSEDDGFDDGNYYAIERKLYIKLGIKSYAPQKRLHPKVKSSKEGVVFIDNRKADFSEAFGFHVYEHNLLLPENENATIDKDTFLYQYRDNDRTDYSKDPYSMKVTVVLPGWLDIVQNHQFRDIVEDAIMEEFPAHIAVKICWIDPLQMYEIEEAYISFLNEKKSGAFGTETKCFIKKLSKLRNIYQNIQLFGQKNHKVTLLGYSSLECNSYRWNE